MNFYDLDKNTLLEILNFFDDYLTFYRFKRVSKLCNSLYHTYCENKILIPKYIWIKIDYANSNWKEEKNPDPMCFITQISFQKMNKKICKNDKKWMRLEISCESGIYDVKNYHNFSNFFMYTSPFVGHRNTYGLIKLDKNHTHIWMCNFGKKGKFYEINVGLNPIKYIDIPECDSLCLKEEHSKNCSSYKMSKEVGDFICEYYEKKEGGIGKEGIGTLDINSENIKGTYDVKFYAMSLNIYILDKKKEEKDFLINSIHVSEYHCYKKILKRTGDKYLYTKLNLHTLLSYGKHEILYG